MGVGSGVREGETGDARTYFSAGRVVYVHAFRRVVGLGCGCRGGWLGCDGREREKRKSECTIEQKYSPRSAQEIGSRGGVSYSY